MYREGLGKPVVLYLFLHRNGQKLHISEIFLIVLRKKHFFWQTLEESSEGGFTCVKLISTAYMHPLCHLFGWKDESGLFPLQQEAKKRFISSIYFDFSDLINIVSRIVTRRTGPYIFGATQSNDGNAYHNPSKYKSDEKSRRMCAVIVVPQACITTIIIMLAYSMSPLFTC